MASLKQLRRPDSSPFLRWFLTAAAVVAGVLALVVSAANHDPAYVGTSRKITLEWGGCAAVTGWWPPGQHSYSWWADSEPTAWRRRESAAPHNARGTIRFMSRSHATFRSESGWTLMLHREPSTAPHVLGCSIG